MAASKLSHPKNTQAGKVHFMHYAIMLKNLNIELKEKEY
jgi:hypothetical protein